MQQPSERIADSRTLNFKASWLPYAILVASVGMTMVGIFVLSTWAEVCGWHHAAQHAIIFSSGCGAGGSLLYISKTKKEVK